jgi:hypothetical protein
MQSPNPKLAGGSALLADEPGDLATQFFDQPRLLQPLFDAAIILPGCY